MKSRFSTIDIAVVIRELIRFIGMRVMNVYDVDHKTYLIRLGKPDDKAMILIESGIRIHSTEFEWPKNPAPSGFSMKLRKHVKNRRLESVTQLGVDRILDLQFGSGEAAYHVILELYDRGNIVLTDFEYTILNILRPRTDTSQDVKFAVRETYPLDSAKDHVLPTEERLREIILGGKEGDMLRKVLIPHLDYGPAVIDHCLIGAGLAANVKIGKGFNVAQDMGKVLMAIEEAEDLMTILQTQAKPGVIIQKSEKRPDVQEGEAKELLTYDEFHPMLFRQFEKRPHMEFETFNKAVDEFYSKMESQKLDMKALQQEKSALKKLDNIKKDHEKRVEGLQKEQEVDITKGRLIEINLPLVDRAIQIMRSAIANQIDWTEIKNIVKEAQATGDPVAEAIKDVKLDSNQFAMLLKNPYVDSDFEDDSDGEVHIKPMKVDIDISLSAYSNSRKYFEKKKFAAKKEQKTIDASTKALKSAERKTKETLKEVATAISINKARKTYWFEKFLWFISSENFLVIGGRDQQQNELLVKRYLRSGDVYVHADLHGASSVIIKNSTSEPVPPKTLNEAGTMAICNSAAWDAKVVTSAWWVNPEQVSKTAPSGEYLTTGSFMIRGKKNYLPPSYLVYGFGVLFKLEDGSIFRHGGERKIRTTEEDEVSIADSSVTMESEVTIDTSSVKDSSDEESEDDMDAQECIDADGNERDGQGDGVGDDSDDAVVKSDIQECSESSERTTEGEEKCETCDRTSEENVKGTGEIKSEEIQSGEVKTEELKSEETKSEDEEESAFPDTEISLQHVKGGKYELMKGRSDSNQSTEFEPIYLGDNQPVTIGDKGNNGGAKLSAKQRREMRKAKKSQFQQQQVKEEEEEREETSGLMEESQRRGKKHAKADAESSSNQQQQQQPKRGQKTKMKKIKEKYKDQDEEERHLRMEILASAGSKKEDKKKGKKGQDKGKGQTQEKGRPQSGANRPQSGKGPQQGMKKKPELVDIIIQDVQDLQITDPVPTEKAPKEDGHESDGEKQEEEIQATADDMKMLDSLTGCPVAEDELLFGIPVCAPYNCLTNYKYKVKLLPGSTKRGKAAKTALNMFQHERSITPREKDLIKILKDADVSRNIPGKVKVTAPNLQKLKRK